MKRGVLTAVSLALASVGLGAPVWFPAQPEPPPSRAEDRAAVRARLERRLEDSRRVQERLTQALERLDAGAPLDEVRAAEGPGRAGRQGQRRGGPGGPPREGQPPPPDERRAAMQFIERHAPEMASRLAALRERDPGAADRMLDRLVGRVREVMAERDPALRDARIAEFRNAHMMVESSRRYSELIRNKAPQEEVAAARQELRTRIGEQFDLRLKRHEAEIKVLEQRLQRIRADVEEYTTKRDEVIDRAVQRAAERAERPGGDEAPPPEDPRGR